MTDSKLCISPGALCREYLMSHMSPTTVIVLGNHSGEKIISCSIASLYPMPYLYRMTRRTGIDKKFVETVSKMEESIFTLYTMEIPHLIHLE